MSRQNPSLSILLYTLAAIWVIIAAFPFAWTVWGSFKFETDFFGRWTKPITGEDTQREYGAYFTADGYNIAFSLPVETVPSLEDVLPVIEALDGVDRSHPAVAPILEAIALEVMPTNGQLRQFSRWLRNKTGLSDQAQAFVDRQAEDRLDNVSGKGFGHAVRNTLIVTLCVVVISLTFGTLGGYALARSTAKYAFWILIIALVFRAMPHITLVSGYMEPLFATRIPEEIPMPWWSFSEWAPTSIDLRNVPIIGWILPAEGTLWGRTFISVIVLVAINQPFTIWMMRSFFMNIPAELDESALVDGCNRFQGFWYVIMPVMWPGVITTGLFSFLLAYNDFAVTSALLSQENTTMIPRIAGFLGSAQADGEQMAAVAAVVSATAPLFVLIMVFQRQLVGGLTAGAVKG